MGQRLGRGMEGVAAAAGVGCGGGGGGVEARGRRAGV